MASSWASIGCKSYCPRGMDRRGVRKRSAKGEERRAKEGERAAVITIGVVEPTGGGGELSRFRAVYTNDRTYMAKNDRCPCLPASS